MAEKSEASESESLNREELYEHYENLKQTYIKTGEISDEFLPCFDQNGNWYGLGYGFGIKIVLPKEKITRKDSSGATHLLTSFIWKDTGPLNLEYQSIGGDLDADKVTSIFAPNLQEVKGHLDLNNAKSCDLPQLERVGGYIDFENGQRFSAPKLIRVGSYLDARETEAFTAPNLVMVVGELHLPYLKFLKISQLLKINNSTQSDLTQKEIKRELEERKRMAEMIDKIKGVGLSL